MHATCAQPALGAKPRTCWRGGGGGAACAAAAGGTNAGGQLGAIGQSSAIPLHLCNLLWQMAEAIRDPLGAVRALHAARAADDDQEFGVKARFAALIADPALGQQASHHLFLNGPARCSNGPAAQPRRISGRDRPALWARRPHHPLPPPSRRRR